MTKDYDNDKFNILREEFGSLPMGFIKKNYATGNTRGLDNSNPS